MTPTKHVWWAGLLLLIALPAFADGVTYQSIATAAQKNNDLSRQALVMIFGDVVINPFASSRQTLIGSLFALLNGVLGAVGIFWFLALTVKGLVKSGHMGQVFSTGRTALYPIMTFAGFLALIPTGSGWSIAQLSMLWAASTMGIGTANLLSDKAVDMLGKGYSLVTQPTAPSTRAAARAVFEMNLCKYAINRELTTLYADGAARTPLMVTRGGQGDYSTGNGSALCGTAKVAEKDRTASISLLFDSKVNTESVMAAQRQGLDTMQQALDQAAKTFVDGYLQKRDRDTGKLPDAETMIQNAAADYEQTVNLAVNQINYNDTLQSQLTSQIKSYGWVALGSWYHTFATANSKTNSVAHATPAVTGMTQTGELGVGDLYNQVLAAYRTQIQNSPYTAPLGTQTAKEDGAAATAAEPEAVFVGMFKSPMQRLTNTIATWKIGTSASFSNQVNPLIKMQEIGDYTLGSVQLLMGAYAVAYGAVSATTNSIVGTATRTFAVDGAAVAKDVMSALSPMFYFLMFTLLGIGVSLAVFLPAVPFIFWMIGIFNWIVSVLVGVAAGPLWAATHLGAEEEKGARSAYGYVFLIDMMIRPALMVFGFFFAGVSVMAGGTLLNLLFASALANANADSIIGLIKLIGWLMIYARIATFCVTRIFGLQATLADYVISFLGGRDGANLMGGMVDNVKGMFGGFAAGAQRMPGPKSMPRRDNPSGAGDGIQ